MQDVAAKMTIQDYSDRLQAIIDHVGSVFRGKPDIVKLTLAALVADGHVLLEDVPGVGKTTLALALARTLGLEFQRVQFTSDLLPADITGVSVYSQKDGSFTFKPGPIFANLVLADEINRTTPRTQSALLEAMSEQKVSIDDKTYDLPSPFIVMATQNPLEHHGTYPLPESQLDRFLLRLSIGYPAKGVERAILLDRKGENPVFDLETLLDQDEFAGIQIRAKDVKISEPVVDYIMAIVEATRSDARVRIGVSTRGALALAQACKALALIEGRDFVIPDDARALVVPALAHRITPSTASGAMDMVQVEGLIEDIVAEIPIPT